MHTNWYLKLKFKKDLLKFRNLINKFDPIGLYDMGCPEDEYDCLTYKVLSYIRKKKSKEEIKELILTELEFHFGASDYRELEEPYKSKFNRNLTIYLNEIFI